MIIERITLDNAGARTGIGAWGVAVYNASSPAVSLTMSAPGGGPVATLRPGSMLAGAQLPTSPVLSWDEQPGEWVEIGWFDPGETVVPLRDPWLPVPADRLVIYGGADNTGTGTSVYTVPSGKTLIVTGIHVDSSISDVVLLHIKRGGVDMLEPIAVYPGMNLALQLVLRGGDELTIQSSTGGEIAEATFIGFLTS